MTEVRFEWADGPNANAEFHRMQVFSLAGEKIEPRMQEKAFHKNGQWSYHDQLVFVPEGSIIYQSDQSTHGSKSRTVDIWVAVAGRPNVFHHWGLWGALPMFPEIEENPHISQVVFEKILRQIVSEKILAQWEQGSAIQAI